MSGSALPMNADDVHGGTAGFGIRAGARIVDTFFIGVLAAISGIMGMITLEILAALGAAPPDFIDRVRQIGFSIYVWGFIASTLYHAACEAIGGATFGKLIFGLRVLSQDYSPCRAKGALVRSIAFLIDGLFFGTAGYGKMCGSALRQRIGDRWGGTIVVRAAFVPEASRRTVGPVILGLFGGGAAAVLCGVFGTVLGALG